jgi:pimeloyl-ACP methyl ester carboxylesterase
MSFFARLFIATSLRGVSFASLATGGGAAAAATPVKTVILVHGAWADGSSWSKLIPLLKSKGLTVVAVQLPLTSLEADATVTKRAIDNAEGPVLLVAHSWGGSVITEAGNDPKVVGLVYIAASAPDVGESFADLIKPYPPAPALGDAKEDAKGFFYLTPKGMRDDFAPDLPPAESSVMESVQGPLSAVAFGDKNTQAAWKTKPSWYIVAQNDRVIPVDLERSLAVRIKATTITIPSSHVIMLSHPDEVFSFVEKALNALGSGAPR